MASQPWSLAFSIVVGWLLPWLTQVTWQRSRLIAGCYQNLDNFISTNQTPERINGRFTIFNIYVRSSSYAQEFLVTYLSLTYGDERTLERLRAIGLLKAFSFVSSGDDNSIFMHRLIQLVMRRWPIKEDTMEYFLRKAIFTIHGVSTLTSDDDTSTRVLHNIPHILIPLSIFHSTFGANMWSRTNTLEMFKLTILAAYKDLIFHLGANGLAEEVLDIRLDIKKDRLGTEASAAIFADDYHAL
ncbi:hypothetical protein DER46DRAFT_687511 [Fusarium sp. MPI-SDFR-AT-0072]|nr:hypothetical protein DER46DRAFT_687511 [Fusarium sp. MPI-SDFR-AT-0072]